MGRGDSHSADSSGGSSSGGSSGTSPLAALSLEKPDNQCRAARSSSRNMRSSMASSRRATPGHQWPLRAALPALLLLLLAAAGVTRAQQLTPFQGRGRPPAGGVDVYVSAVVDHLVTIDDANYRFEVVLYMLLTWQDVRAAPAVDAATKASTLNPTTYNNGQGCAYPCTTIYAWQADPNATNLCCDNIWLPHFEMINVRGFSQDRVERYGIRLGENNSVGWWAHIQGELYTPLQFRSFPFDRQYLSVQLQYGNKYPDSPVNIIPSATGTQLYSPASGDKLSGWSVKAVYMKNLNLSQGNLLREGAATASAPGDPWPLNPADPSKPTFSGFLWQNGIEIYVEVERISNYYVITAILPICINTLLALLVFSVSPRHLDTRLGIVVTLFLSLTALQYVIAAGLPSSSTVVPTQQLIIVSYCILAGVGVSSIVVFWMVSLHRTRERRRRLKRAQRAFSSRWHSVTSSMGFAVTAAAMVVQRSRASSATSAGGDAARQVSFADELKVHSPNHAPQRAAAPSLQQRQAQQARQSQQAGAGNNAAGSSAAIAAAAAALMASPFASKAPAAAAGVPSQQEQQQQGLPPSASCREAVDASQLPELPVEPAASQVAERRQLLGLPPLAEAPEGPQAGGMGVFTGSSESSLHSSGDDGSSEDDSGEGSLRTARVPAPAAAVPAAAAAAAAVDEEEAGGGPKQRRRLARWRRRALSCCKPAAAGAGGNRGPGGAAAPRPNWFKLLWLKLRLMKEEMRANQDYAMLVAMSIDRHIFWMTLCGFTIAVILIFAIQAQNQPQPLD